MGGFLSDFTVFGVHLIVCGLGVVTISLVVSKLDTVLSDLHSFLLAVSFEGEVKSKNVHSLLSSTGTASCT